MRCLVLLLLSGAQQHPGLTTASAFPEKPSEEPEPGDPAEQSGLAAEDPDPSGSASAASSLQDLTLLMKTSVSVTLPPRSVEAGTRSPEDITFTAGGNPSVQDIQGGSGEEPNVLVSITLNMTHSDVEHRSPEGSGGSSGGGWPEPTDPTPPTGKDEAEETVKVTLSPRQTFTDSWTPESSSPAAQEVSTDGESSSSVAVTEEQEEKEEKEEQEEQQLSSIRISGGFSALLFFFSSSFIIIEETPSGSSPPPVWSLEYF